MEIQLTVWVEPSGDMNSTSGGWVSLQPGFSDSKKERVNTHREIRDREIFSAWNRWVLTSISIRKV